MKLQVHVLEARGLPEKNRSAVSGVFVRLKMGSTKARTASVERTSAPSWYEDFFFKVHDLSAELVVTVCNGDQGFLGQVKVPIATIFNADKQMLPPSWYALQKRSRKSKTPVTEVFEFDATDDAPSTMDIEVFDFEGPFLESESLGYAEINFLKQFPEELADLWVPLQGKHAQSNASRLHLRICLTNTKESDLVSYYIQKVEEEVGKKIVRRSPQQNSTFQRLFSLPPEEFLINDFACAIRRKLHLQGRLFLSPRMLGFYSNIFGHKSKFSILWEDIDEVQEMLPGLGSVGLFFNPSILVFTKKGRAKDAYHYAKSLDAKGRFKFQFQSFVRFGLAYRTIMALWRNRTLSLEQQMEIVANVEAGEADYGAGKNQADDTETFLGLEEANMSEVYSTKLPFTVESLVLIYDRESLDEKIMDKMGCMNYTTPPWEQVGDNPRLQQRQQIYKLNHRLCRFGSHVMRIQQKSMSDDAQECVIAEVFTLHDVPFGDHFQVQVRKEILTLSCDPPMSSCKVFLGVAWQKSTLFQERITRNCLESFTKLLKEELELTIKALLAYKNE